ncbi:ABC transporter ATP-binding protein [Exiguobacterium oxidotolerans]|uniref:ABC transporter ATP-binding protein n=1 Tax=Exiguobacterium oxidotolerans TaxID=223958 RepID=UPI000493E5D9|nr:ATP-binding cassette domain-containing protein [Exiguobacterium oxidotolerans]
MNYSFTCKELNKSFDTGEISTAALSNINLTFSQEDFISIIGPSGSGKSTLLSIIGTLDTPTSGGLYFNGLTISNLNARQLSDFRFENIGFIFQKFHLIPTLTVLENVLSPLFGRKVNYDKEDECGVLFVTNDPILAKRANKVIEMKEGRVVKGNAYA